MLEASLIVGIVVFAVMTLEGSTSSVPGVEQVLRNRDGSVDCEISASALEVALAVVEVISSRVRETGRTLGLPPD